MSRRPQLNPGALPPGSSVGPWQVARWHARGGNGTVYQAVKQGQEGAGPVALKLALYPEDRRFGREAGLLSRLQHPHVPRLLESGQWRHPSGAFYPYLAMEWVEGVPLYAWGQGSSPSSRQVMRVLAQLARALEATHAAGGVHRDVKGDNILVQPSTARAYLMDFGSGIWTGASRLTEEALPPGTRPYRSPEALRFHTARYEATPLDDVYALGVTAYRWVTGVYPERSALAQVLNPKVAPSLAALIERMLAEAPEARGSASALAEALEEAVRRTGPEADVPLFFSKGVPKAFTASVQGRARMRPFWKVAPLVGLVLASMGWLLLLRPPLRGGAREPVDTEATAGLATAASTEPVGSQDVPSGGEAITLDMPQQPLPGQLRPNTSGKCPGRSHTPIRGGCWRALEGGAENCGEDEYVHAGKCYAPVFSRARPSTSASPRDAGSP
ncbi:Serine/threonine protein kinase [Stigmatella erecta]|uniref:Serine/threonine protein kinase n=1 Tax=Stigmatella erecta TaxID=83460 RepID=A0A1I0L8K2_9BACT|nr:serine/threonine-protein kinase [Stigmatella erecta]SEU36197.1 Serine/threonine protein kinase [Stigmatella erecta]